MAGRGARAPTGLPDHRRATIIASVGDGSDAAAAAEAWFARWRDHLSYCSDRRGCACCIWIWDVAGPGEAIGEIPRDLRATSAWAERGPLEMFIPEPNHLPSLPECR